MFLHEFGDNLILTLNLLAQESDRADVSRLGVRCFALEGDGPVLEELLLPGVELSGLELKLVAEVRDGDLVDQMATKNGDFFGR
jgi:hypothetical protein